MLDKEYLEKLKEEDYIAWDSLVNDPYMVGSGGDDVFDFIMLLILIAVIAGVLILVLN